MSSSTTNTVSSAAGKSIRSYSYISLYNFPHCHMCLSDQDQYKEAATYALLATSETRRKRKTGKTISVAFDVPLSVRASERFSCTYDAPLHINVRELCIVCRHVFTSPTLFISRNCKRGVRNRSCFALIVKRHHFNQIDIRWYNCTCSTNGELSWSLESVSE